MWPLLDGRRFEPILELLSSPFPQLSLNWKLFFFPALELILGSFKRLGQVIRLEGPGQRPDVLHLQKTIWETWGGEGPLIRPPCVLGWVGLESETALLPQVI